MNKKSLSIGIILSGIIYASPIVLLMLILLHISSFCLIEKKHIQEKSVTLFKEAVKEDFQNRSTGLTERLTSMAVPSTATASDSSIFRSETIEIKTPISQNQSLDEKMTDFLQSVLAVKNPINVYQLDTIFQQKLKENNIHMATAICLTDTINKKNNSCTNFNIASFIPLFTDPYQISSIGISLKSYIKISQHTLIRRMPTLYWIALFGWFLFASSILYAWNSLRKKVPALIKEKEQLSQEKIKENLAFTEREGVLQNELIKKEEELETLKQFEKQKENGDIHILSSHLTFEKNTKTLRHKGETVKLTLLQQELLTTFCNAPEYCCSTKDLHNLAWKKSKVEENTVQQAIYRLNQVLKEISGISIKYKFKNSYILTFPKE